MLIFLCCLGIIITCIGTNIGYTGVDTSFCAYDYILSLGKILKKRMGLYFSLMLIAICIIAFEIYKQKMEIKNQWVRFRILEIVFVIIFCFPQIVLYAKSGLYTRFLIPCILGIFIYFIFIEKLLFDKKKSFIVFLSIFIFLGLKGYLNTGAVAYAEICKQNMMVFNQVKNLTVCSGKENSKIVIGSIWAEDILTIRTFLNYYYGIDEIYGIFGEKNISQEEEIIKDGNILIDKEGYFKRKIQKIGLSLNNYKKFDFGHIIVYVKQ